MFLYIKKTTGNVGGSNPLPLLGGLGFVAFILVATHPFCGQAISSNTSLL